MKNLFGSIIDITSGTPLYVWAILVYFLFIGINATRDRIVYLPKLFIIPAILIGLTVYNFSSDNHFYPFYLLFMMGGLFIGGTLGIKTPFTILKNSNSIEIPGSYSTLIILLLFFSVKYIFGYMQAHNAEMAQKYSSIVISIQGLFSGYFLGRSLSFVYNFKKGRH